MEPRLFSIELVSEQTQRYANTSFIDIYHDPDRNIFIEIFVWTILGIGLLDFVVQSLIILAVFTLSLFEPLKISRKIFAVFIILIFILIRLALFGTVIRPFLQSWFSTLSPTLDRVYWYSTTALTLTVFAVGIILGLVYICKYGVSASKCEPVERDASAEDGTKDELPMIAILMPIYNEVPDALSRAIDSMFAADYPSSKKHLFLSFDELEETELYFYVLKKFGVLNKTVFQEILESEPNNNVKPKDCLFPARIDLNREGIRVTISRFPHGGKNSTQGHAFRIVKDLYEKQSANTFIFSIDSDIILHENALHNFIHYARRNKHFIAATGLLSVSTQGSYNVYQYMQNAEYVESQLFIRAGEAGLGAVTCMPGAMTMIKMENLLQVADTYYYRDEHENIGSSFGFHMRALGEDRYLTYLLTKTGDRPYQIGFVPNAQCKTDAPDTFATFLKQRRRWCLGAMACEVYMMTSPKMWSRFPFMIIYKMFIYESRSLDWFSWVALLSLFYNFDHVSNDYGLLLFPMTVLLKYIVLVFFCICSKRLKICIFYIILVIFMPVFTIIVAVYSAFTWNVRSWGGPRMDGAKEQVSKIQILSRVMEQHDSEFCVDL